MGSDAGIDTHGYLNCRFHAAICLFRFLSVSLIPMGIVRQRRKAETRALLLQAGLSVFAERGIELATLDEVAQSAGFTKGAIYRQFPSKGGFLLALFEQYAAVARAGTGARRAAWFIPLTIQFAAQAMRDPLLRRRFAVVLAEAPDGGSPDGQLLKALGRVMPAAHASVP
jgi:AcrR family transcriptional regulator